MTKKQRRSSNKSISDLDAFKRDAMAKIYAGKALTGKNGVIKKF